ncbi:MAG: RNA polymerase sigma factor RpoD/SigA [Candidatus Pacebacteria bacterium]|nr:RNA polymerase sigma factor RpoD/SigA [Candidatus Paceibacterota bacterium]
MKAYMQDVGHIPLVTRKEEVELAGRISAGDDAARQKLIRSNLRLVVKIAHDFKGLGLPLVDLISEGNIGLMRAVDKFDPNKGAKFSSYAAWWIKQSMRRALANQSRTIRIPVQSAGKINKIKTVRTKLAQSLGREPTDAEIADELDFSERTVSVLRRSGIKSFSLNESIQEGESGDFEDVIADLDSAAPDEIAEEAESNEFLLRLVEDLDERERLILTKRFGLDGTSPKTLQELSGLVGRTRERVRQIQYQALAKLKKKLKKELSVSSYQVTQDENSVTKKRG